MYYSNYYGDVYQTLEVVTPPAAEPVTAAELKEHLHNNEEDSTLGVFISAAREHFQHLTRGRIVMPTTFRQSFAAWPYYQPIRLAVGNVSAVSSVTYYDQAEAQQTLGGTSVDLTGTPALIYLPTGSFPSLSTTRPRPVSITFVAGWANAAAVPPSVRLSILLLAAHYAQVREAYGEANLKAVPAGFTAFCQQWNTGLGGF